MGNIEGLDRAVAQLEKQAYDQSEGDNVRSAVQHRIRISPDMIFDVDSGALGVTIWDHISTAI